MPDSAATLDIEDVLASIRRLVAAGGGVEAPSPAPPAPDRERPALSAEFVAPRSPVEEMLADSWVQVLDLAEVGIRAGAAVGLGVLLTPLGALLPTIQLGTGEDGACAGLLKGAATPPRVPPARPARQQRR